MRIIKVEDINKGEILAKDVLACDYQMLLRKGTVLKKEYIDKLIELDIKEVYIEEIIEIEENEMVLMKEEMEIIYKNTIQSILEKHIYKNNEELSEISKVADKIIGNILDEKKVMEKVYDIKGRNADIYEHCISLCTLAILTSLKLGLEMETVHDVGVACLLHDLGLRYLVINYKNQNLLELSEYEYAEYKKHPIYAYSVLEEEDWISEKCKRIILMHHEHLDGSGYPLHTKEIPLEAKIVCVCDVFDEMISGIGCMRTEVHEAIEYLKIYKGSLYDTDVINTFLQFTAAYPVGTKIRTNNGLVGVVIKQNKEFSERPMIRLIERENGSFSKEKQIIDLLVQKNIFIKDVIH